MGDAFWVTAARSDVAALADNALTFEGTGRAHEQVLLEFDVRVPRIRARIGMGGSPSTTCATSTPVV